jgi:hypothetical protein
MWTSSALIVSPSSFPAQEGAMEDRDRPPLGAEFYERIEAALYSVQTRYGAKLKLFAEGLPGASPIDRVLGGYEDVLPPKQPIALCKHLRE